MSAKLFSFGGVLAIAVATVLLTSEPAQAAPRGGYYRGYHGRYHGGYYGGYRHYRPYYGGYRPYYGGYRSYSWPYSRGYSYRPYYGYSYYGYPY
jgi:hypothetical protein